MDTGCGSKPFTVVAEFCKASKQTLWRLVDGAHWTDGQTKLKAAKPVAQNRIYSCVKSLLWFNREIWLEKSFWFSHRWWCWWWWWLSEYNITSPRILNCAYFVAVRQQQRQTSMPDWQVENLRCATRDKGRSHWAEVWSFFIKRKNQRPVLGGHHFEETEKKGDQLNCLPEYLLSEFRSEVPLEWQSKSMRASFVS